MKYCMSSVCHYSSTYSYNVLIFLVVIVVVILVLVVVVAAANVVIILGVGLDLLQDLNELTSYPYIVSICSQFIKHKGRLDEIVRNKNNHQALIYCIIHANQK